MSVVALTAHIVRVGFLKNGDLSRIAANTHVDDFDLRITGLSCVLLIVVVLVVRMRHGFYQMVEDDARLCRMRVVAGNAVEAVVDGL